MSEPKVLGYVLVSAGANRDPCLPHTSVTKDRADVEHERREWAKRGDRYIICRLVADE